MDDHITAALEEFIADTQRLYDAAQQQTPRDKTEISYWRAQLNAFPKAHLRYLEGARLTATSTGYLIPSASRPGALVHRCFKIGDIWSCSCEAGERGMFHWHTALICAYERGAELATLATIPAWIADEDAQLAALPDDDPSTGSGTTGSGTAEVDDDDDDDDDDPITVPRSPSGVEGIMVTTAPAGALTLTRGDTTEVVSEPTDLRAAIERLGQRIADARAATWAQQLVA
jgi:hypothetical protein